MVATMTFFQGLSEEEGATQEGGKQVSTAMGNDRLALLCPRGEQGHPGVCNNQPKVGMLGCIKSVHRLLTLKWPCTSSKGMERGAFMKL